MIINYKSYKETYDYVKVLQINNSDIDIKEVCDNLNINEQIFKYNKTISIITPFIENLLNNSNINIDIVHNKIPLLIAITTVLVYLKENDTNIEKDEIEKNIQSLLEEIRLSSIGDVVSKDIYVNFTHIINTSKEQFNISNDDILLNNIFLLFIIKLTKYTEEYNVSFDTFYMEYMNVIDEISEHINKIGIDEFIKLLSKKEFVINNKLDNTLLIDSKKEL